MLFLICLFGVIATIFFWCVAHDFLLLRVKRNDVDFYIQPFGGRDEDLPKLFAELQEAHQGKPF